jgi:hydroxymethylbilane synthase
VTAPFAAPRTLRIGTRGSALALAQTRLVEQALVAAGADTIEVVTLTTDGDRRAADTPWGEGAFVAAIERALLEGQIDVAVHSAKDVPTVEDERLVLAAYLPREDARDALVVRVGGPATGVVDLAPGSRVGTDSPRRTGFLRAMRPDLDVHPLHGNVDTRLRRLDEGDTDALVLAVAGLTRLGREDRIAERLDPRVVPPAPGQGAICVQVRRDDGAALATIARIDDPATRTAVEAERAFLAASGGGCRAPIGALAHVVGDRLELAGGYVRPDGTSAVVDQVDGPASEGHRLAAGLAERMASRSPSTRKGPLRPTVLVTRARDQSVDLMRALDDAGVRALSVPAIEIQPADPAPLDAAAQRLEAYAWVVVTSANGAAATAAAVARVGAATDSTRWAAVGIATARALEMAGITVAHRPRRATGRAIADELPINPGDAVLLVRGDLAGPELPEGLRARGADVEEVVAYRTVEAPDPSRPLLAEALDRHVDAILFASGSAARGLLALAADAERVRSIPAVCIGPETAAEATRLGFHVLREAPMASAEILARVTAETLAPPETT